jgi:hypothetical protein
MHNLAANLGGYFELSLIMIEVRNFYIILGDYFELSLIMEEVGNLDGN